MKSFVSLNHLFPYFSDKILNGVESKTIISISYLLVHVCYIMLAHDNILQVWVPRTVSSSAKSLENVAPDCRLVICCDPDSTNVSDRCH